MGQILCLPVDLIVKFLFQILLELPKLVQAPAHIQLLLIIKGDHLRSALKLPMLRLFPLELYFLWMIFVFILAFVLFIRGLNIIVVQLVLIALLDMGLELLLMVHDLVVY